MFLTVWSNSPNGLSKQIIKMQIVFIISLMVSFLVSAHDGALRVQEVKIWLRFLGPVYISSWFIVDKAQSRAIGLKVQTTHILPNEYFITSLAPSSIPLFYNFSAPWLFYSNSFLVWSSFPTEDSSVDGAGSHYQLFSLTTPRVRQRCRETQYYTTQHNHMEHMSIWYGALLFVAEAEKILYLK